MMTRKTTSILSELDDLFADEESDDDDLDSVFADL